MKLTASLKSVQANYALTVLFALAISAYILSSQTADSRLWLLLLLPAALGLYTVLQHLKLAFTSLTIENNHLRYESGMFSKSTRTMDLSKLQDVRVDQSFTQRLMGIGNLSIESAGSSSQIVMLGIDRPQEAADKILKLAHQH